MNKQKPYPYLNRELSWLAFNRRVLEQAEGKNYPLLERMKYLAFFGSNLDEFFEVRVAGLMQQIKSGNVECGPDGIEPKDQLNRIESIVKELIDDQFNCWYNKIVPKLEKEQIYFRDYCALTSKEKLWAKQYFEQQVLPILTPIAIEPANPFPHLVNKALYILTALIDQKKSKNKSLMGIVTVPRILPRILKINVPRRDSAQVYIALSDIIKNFIKDLFPGYRTRCAAPFRITRNSELYIDEEEITNLLGKIEDELINREKGAVVRLEIAHGADLELQKELLEALKLRPQSLYTINGPINFARLMSAYDLIDRPDLKFKPYTPYINPKLEQQENLFKIIRNNDYLLHHPYDSFQPIVNFITLASKDPDVLSIKQTLYRTSGDSLIVQALKDASINGKQVTVLIELKARFDEANNIRWAKELEEVGVQVVYGLAGLKTHCKVCLIIRREGNQMRYYTHLGTGNYNTNTAKLYADLSLITASKPITSEVANLFNALTGLNHNPKFSKLLVAPFNLQPSIIRFIQTEIKNAQAGKPARIIIKANSLIDKKTIDFLYKASQAGVTIDLIIRGICALVPKVKGISENITVRSLLGRYLEHSRIYYFENSSKNSARIYAGSADWMPRNFYRRVEVMFPIEDQEIHAKIFHILEVYMKDNIHTHYLNTNGSYKLLKKPLKRSKHISSQNTFIEETKANRKKLTYIAKSHA